MSHLSSVPSSFTFGSGPDFSAPPDFVSQSVYPLDAAFPSDGSISTAVGISEFVRETTLPITSAITIPPIMWYEDDKGFRFGSVYVTPIDPSHMDALRNLAAAANLNNALAVAEGIAYRRLIENISKFTASLSVASRDVMILSWRLIERLGFAQSADEFRRYTSRPRNAEWWAPWAMIGPTVNKTLALFRSATVRNASSVSAASENTDGRSR